MVGHMSNFMEDPLEDHLDDEIKDLLYYVDGSCNYEVKFPKLCSLLKLIRFTDSDVVRDIDERSMSNLLFLLKSSPIS
jgi:hypothetical protein